MEVYDAPLDEQTGGSNQYLSVNDSRSPRRNRNQSAPSKATPRSAESSMYYLETVPVTGQPASHQSRKNKASTSPTVYLDTQVIQHPIFYNIANSQTNPTYDSPPPSPLPPPSYIPKETSAATVYSLANRPRSNTINITDNISAMPYQNDDKSATLYSLTGNNIPQKKIQEPTEQFSKPSPQFYSLIGNPARTSRGVQVDMLGPEGPAPILYTIVGDTPIEKSRAKENQPPMNMKDRSPDSNIYALRPDRDTMRSQYPIQKPTVYALVQKPQTPPKPPTKQPGIKQAPTAVFIGDRTNRSSERRPEPKYEEPISQPARHKTEFSPREPRYPKGEALVIPYNDEPVRTRPAVVHQEPIIYTHAEPVQRRPHPKIQNQPIQLPEYRSVYAYRTQKPYRERKINNYPMTVASTSRAEPKPRRPLYETHSHTSRRQPSAVAKPKSLERSPGHRSAHSHVYNSGYRSQTDDEDYDRRINKKKLNHKSTPPRVPWVPVW